MRKEFNFYKKVLFIQLVPFCNFFTLVLKSGYFSLEKSASITSSLAGAELSPAWL